MSFLIIGQKLLDSLAETWDFFFGDVLSMLQAIFHPVQVRKHPLPLDTVKVLWIWYGIHAFKLVWVLFLCTKKKQRMDIEGKE